MATVNVASNSDLSAVTYAAGDIISVNDGVTLTITTTPSVLPGAIRALGTGIIRTTNSSTTTMLKLAFLYSGWIPAMNVEQNGQWITRGNFITVATGTGSASQTLMTTTNVGGQDIRFPTRVEVETGSGTGVYEEWMVVPEDVTGGEVNTYGFNKAKTSAGSAKRSSRNARSR